MTARCSCLYQELYQGACYWHTKAAAGLVRGDFGLPVPGAVGEPSPEQLRWIAVEDPDTSGKWNHSAVPASDLFAWLLAHEPVTGLDRTVPEHWEQQRNGDTDER